MGKWNAVTGTLEEHGSIISEGWGLDPHVVVNGMYKPKITLQEGQWTRLRFVMAAIEMRVEIHQKDEMDNQAQCNFQLLAKDGIYLHEAPRTIGAIYLASGARADVAVQCKCGFMAPRPCKSELEFRAVWQPMGLLGAAPTLENTTQTLLSIETQWSGKASDPPLESFSVRRPCYLVDLRDADVKLGNQHK